jgi:putative protease
MQLKDGAIKEIELSEENLELFDFFLEEGYRPGEFLPFEELERGSYILNSKDLCLMPKMDDYLRIGIDSLKVEGRNKSPYYVASVAKAYRKAIDDYYADPESWDPRPYMRMLETVPNRGYTLAFHEGRLNNYGHNYDQSSTLAAWEFAAMIETVEDDAFFIRPKNRLAAGDVLEFISPYDHPDVLLRIYEFEDAESGRISDVIHAGDQRLIRLPFTLFGHEDIAALKQNFPAMSVIRKEKALKEEEWQRLRLDSTAHNIELGRGRESAYQEHRDNLQTLMDADSESRSVKAPRFGVEGCCGKGCNGCLVFWHDPSYEKARKILKQKKQGEMLSARQARNFLKDWIN